MFCKVQYVCGGLRNLATSSRASSSHYDVLGITPKATQKDIKSAYYELSKVYHPDKSPDEASAKKFRAITEAYEILGNIQTKRMYDKGLIVGKENTSRMGWQPEPEPTDPTLRFYKSRQNRQVAPTMDGRTPIYDFEACSGQNDKVTKTYQYIKTVQEVLRSKRHYGDLIAKAKYDREFTKKQRIKQQERATAYRQETTICLVIALGALCMMLLFNIRDDYDIDNVSGKKIDPKISQVANPTPVIGSAIQVEINKSIENNESNNNS